jgi:hypothetical protein
VNHRTISVNTLRLNVTPPAFLTTFSLNHSLALGMAGSETRNNYPPEDMLIVLHSWDPGNPIHSHLLTFWQGTTSSNLSERLEIGIRAQFPDLDDQSRTDWLLWLADAGSLNTHLGGFGKYLGYTLAVFFKHL